MHLHTHYIISAIPDVDSRAGIARLMKAIDRFSRKFGHDIKALGIPAMLI